MVDAGYYTDLLRPVFSGRKVIIAVDVLVAAGGFAQAARDLGAQPVLAIAGTHGSGQTPEIEHLILGTDGASSIVHGIRAFERTLLDAPPEMVAAMDRADPHREAIIVSAFFTPPVRIAGRPVYGGRRPAWEALEDKVIIDAFFDEARVERAPSVICAPDAFTEHFAAVDRGGGVILAGDAKEGFNGGGEYVRWIRNDDDITEAQAYFGAHCDRVRVMPFLEGVPCSIHGVVVGGDVIALRPIEMLTLRRPGSKFLYAGVATYWDPPDDDRAHMREIARRVGALLRDKHDYRGAFTVDGVLTRDGFRPTELNPRAGGGSRPLTASSGIPFMFLNKAITEGERLDYRPADLERLLVEAADTHRGGAAYVAIPGEAWEQQTHPFVLSPNLRFAQDGEDPDGQVALGPSAVGRYAAFAPQPDKVAPGPSFGPHAVAGLTFIDRHFGAGLGPLEPAEAVR